MAFEIIYKKKLKKKIIFYQKPSKIRVFDKK